MSPRLQEGLSRLPLRHHVIWTGEGGRLREGSVFANVLSCVESSGEPLSIRELWLRIAGRPELADLTSEAVRSAVRQHQKAQPAVLLLVERNVAGEFVAVTDIPHAGRLRRCLRAGATIMDRSGRWRLPEDGGDRPGLVRPVPPTTKNISPWRAAS